MKFKIKQILLPLFLVTLAGCSSTNSDEQASTEQATDIVAANQLEKNNGNAPASSEGQNLANNTEGATTKNKLGYKCENIVLTGTRIKKRICTTAAQRKASKEKAQDFHRHMKIPDSIGPKAQ
ncbi:hypothetical protein RI844_05660 [Thalassotalea fonticola]|uniref:Lipoprotein n=1 Tax=Thalassotalea fonticola TaxID=3065649 RepID=A0ABZ0GSB4_9GAMM|nr:hypothetical protein RI844_05660 [Colwelliaceae bacterium S1-1]